MTLSKLITEEKVSGIGTLFEVLLAMISFLCIITIVIHDHSMPCMFS